VLPDVGAVGADRLLHRRVPGDGAALPVVVFRGHVLRARVQRGAGAPGVPGGARVRGVSAAAAAAQVCERPPRGVAVASVWVGGRDPALLRCVGEAGGRTVAWSRLDSNRQRVGMPPTVGAVWSGRPDSNHIAPIDAVSVLTRIVNKPSLC